MFNASSMGSKIPVSCYLQLGYNPKTRLKADITKIETINGKDTDLAIDKPVYAIHLADVKEDKMRKIRKKVHKGKSS